MACHMDVCLNAQLPGRRILVATSVVKEGLDVPACNLVVRIRPPNTGIQRTQARGRARRQDATYVTLIGVSAASGVLIR